MSLFNSFLSKGTVLIVTFLLLLAVFTINSLIPVLPVSSITFVVTALLLWFALLCLTFIGLHKLLQRKHPIPNVVFDTYLPYVGLYWLAKPRHKVVKPNTESIKRLTAEIDKYFVSYWYYNISEDTNFPTETQAFLEEVLTSSVNTMLQVNHAAVVHGVFNLFLKHLKEFRKSLKRQEKYSRPIEDLYRYSHICSTSNIKGSQEYFLHQLTISLLHRFINSELWNTLPCHILVSVLARKLVTYLLNTLSDPEVLNYIILNSVVSATEKDRLNLQQYGRISVVQFFDVFDTKKELKTECSTKEEVAVMSQGNVKEQVKELERKVREASERHKLLNNGKTDDSSNNKVVLRQRKQIREPNIIELGPLEKSPKRGEVVKIYEPKNTGKTWRDSRDLACVSLGQDPLDMLGSPPSSGGKVDDKPVFWETPVEAKGVDPKRDSPPGGLFTDVIHMPTMEELKTSIKPLSDATERTLHNIKDLQEVTMNNALHKIGDFQVNHSIPQRKMQIDPLKYLHFMPPNTLLHSSVQSNTQRLLQAQSEDEAAGMVEGILDFGRAGFRKGLRLTGLHDNIENAKVPQPSGNQPLKVSKQTKKKLEDLKKDSEAQEKTSSAESADSLCWINPLQDSPNYDGQILLETFVTKSTSEPNQPKLDDLPVLSVSTEDTSGTDSPELEYEDTADLASSIAKLRSLLQQRSSESSLSTPALSPMPSDEFLHKQLESENTSDIEVGEIDGMMTSFYKVCTKTATGVFSNTLNTIKTALPGGGVDSGYSVELWKIKPQQDEPDSLVRMKKLLTERKEYCTLDKEIDAAYDALDSVDVFQQPPKLVLDLQFDDDELDDVEGKMPLTKTLLDVMCELLADTNSPLVQEPVVKSLLLLFGPITEQHLERFIDKGMNYLAENLITIPETPNIKVLSVDIDEFVTSIENSVPEVIKCIFGKGNFRQAVKLLVSSVQKQKINRDVILQAFELIAMKTIEESLRITPFT